jgi:hypothetical protein
MTPTDRHVAFAWPPTISRLPFRNELVAIEKFEQHIIRCYSCTETTRAPGKYRPCEWGTFLAREVTNSIHFRHGTPYSSHEHHGKIQVEIPTYCVAVREFFDVGKRRYGRDSRYTGADWCQTESTEDSSHRPPVLPTSLKNKMKEGAPRGTVRTIIYRRCRYQGRY